MWAGGLLGATLVMCNAYLSAHIGTGMTVMLVLLGQVGGGLLVDRFGLLGVPRKPVAGIQYVGVLVAIVALCSRRCDCRVELATVCELTILCLVWPCSSAG